MLHGRADRPAHRARRLTGLVGLNAVPRRDHVVVVGLGQVGYRLCTLLRECGIPVVVVEADEDDESVGHARRDKLPVVIGRGADPVVLRRLSLDRARALAAVTPDDLTNVEVAMTARSLADELRVVLRAGDGEVAQETGSLFRIGHVIDVHRIARRPDRRARARRRRGRRGGRRRRAEAAAAA